MMLAILHQLPLEEGAAKPGIEWLEEPYFRSSG